jgi:hypothetical protein
MMSFRGMYRGVVVHNVDDKVMGRIKVYVPGIYPEEYAADPMKLPWAEPAMPLFGGSGNWRDMSLNKETGACSVPHANKDDFDSAAQVWVFFEEDDPQKPVYFAACQSGAGWFSEHPNQHRVQTNNVLIQIDDEPSDEKSTSKCDYANQTAETYGNDSGKKKQVETTVTISILNPGKCALNVKIVGDVNMDIDGDYVEHVTGDKYVTVDGSEYKTVKGDTYITQTGSESLIRGGEVSQHTTGKATFLYDDMVTTTSSKQLVIGSPNISWIYKVWNLYTQILTENTNMKMLNHNTLGDAGEVWVSKGGVNRAYMEDEIQFVRKSVLQVAKDSKDFANMTNMRFGGEMISDVSNQAHVTTANTVARTGSSVVADAGGVIAQTASTVNSNMSPVIMDVATLVAHI